MTETMEFEAPRGQIFHPTEDGQGYNAHFAGDSVIRAARKAAQDLLAANEDALAMRTCWVCNAAHIHMIDQTDEFVLNCFGCGRWYFQKTDITIYTEESDDAE